MPVKILLADGAAFGGHVKFSLVRKDHRNGCGQQDVPGENRLVDAA